MEVSEAKGRAPRREQGGDMPKKKGKKKSSKPAWLSEEQYALIQDFPQLVESYKGTQDKSTVPVVVSKTQVAGLWLQGALGCVLSSDRLVSCRL